MKRTAKEEIIEELHERFQKARHAILTDFSGLDVPTINRLRDDLKKLSVEYRVVKNTLVRRACKDTGMEALKDYFSGPTAIAFSEGDPTGALKLMADFMKDQQQFAFKVGWVEGRIADAETLQAISRLPSREELLGKMVASLNAPIFGFLQLLKGVQIKLIRTLLAIREAKEGVDKKH